MTEKKKKKVLISGAGIAGILCAILLNKKKYEIEIIEQSPYFRNLGFSVVLWKSGFELLISILYDEGVYLKEEEDYFKISGFKLFSGSNLKKIKHLDSDNYAWVFEREHLMNILETVLFKNLKKNNLIFSTTIDNIKFDDDNNIPCSLVKFHNKSLNEKRYDMVIIAEGINSSTRQILFPNEKAKFFPYNLKYEWFIEKTNLNKDGGLLFTKGALGVIHPPFFKNLLGFYFKKGHQRISNEFENEVLKIVKLNNSSDIGVDTQHSKIVELKKVDLRKHYYKNVVLIGDAAHGQPPTLGFGTSLAIEDSVQLSRFLNEIKEDDFANNLQNTLNEYQEKRSKRIKNVYDFQNLIHLFLTDNFMMVKFLSFLLKLFLGKYIEKKVKKLSVYEIKPVSIEYLQNQLH